jgi:hypothetical protein
MLIGIEIAKAHIVAQPVREVFQTRRRIEAGWRVHRLISVISIPLQPSYPAPASGCRKVLRTI